MTTEFPLPAVAPVFPMLVGCWRSGTTLLRSVFDSHPDLAVPDETNLLPPLLARFDGSTPFSIDAFLDAVRATPRWSLWGPEEALRDALALDPPSTLADAIRLTYRAYAWKQGKRGYADKTPGHVVVMDRAGELLPETRFVHLVRDGRDVALALRDANFGPRSIDEAALHWSSRVGMARAFGAVLGPSRYREIRYEALVEDPAAAIQPMCEFLGIAFDASMLDHRRSAEALVASTTNAGVHTKLAEPIRPGVRDWRRDMTRSEVARFEMIAGARLVELGYERGAATVPLSTRVDAAARRARLAATRRYRRARGLNSATWW
jgi:hypothetical protein